jgi:hypothetical protein
MPENRHAGRNQEELRQDIGIKELLGVILLVIGAFVACWVFLNVYAIFTDPQELTSFQKLVSGKLESVASAGGKEVKLLMPPEILAYIIPILLLAIGVSVAGVLINGGVNLLCGGYQRFLTRVARLENKMMRKVENVQDLVKETSDEMRKKRHNS